MDRIRNECIRGTAQVDQFQMEDWDDLDMYRIVKEEMQRVVVTEEDARGMMIYWSGTQKEHLKEEDERDWL